MNELRKCPFCGSDAKLIRYGEVVQYGNNYTVECECGADIGFSKTLLAAIKQWNTRADDNYRKEAKEVIKNLVDSSNYFFEKYCAGAHPMKKFDAYANALAAADKFLKGE